MATVVKARTSMPNTAAGLDIGTAFEYAAQAALAPSTIGPVGLELEAHLVDLADPTHRVGWERLQATVAALPALPGRSQVSVEPGGAVELSGPPLPSVAAAVSALRADRAVLRRAFAAVGLGLAAIGTDPVRRPARVNPAPRYAAMEQHFAALGCATAGTAMMTSTAALQVNLEAGPESGWDARVALAHRLGPVLVAVSACSPLLAGQETGWRSSRQRVWADLDQARCGRLLSGRDPAREWARYALAAPVMLVRDPSSGVVTPIRERVPFGSWLDAGSDLGGRAPGTADLDYHLTTLFPPVRLRGFLEIRYLDAAPEPWWPALAAVTATLMDDPIAADAVTEAIEAPGVSDAWDRAARLGLTDPVLHRAARRCLAVAVDRAPETLRTDVSALAELVERGQSPGDRVLQDARETGPAAAFLAATRDAIDDGGEHDEQCP